MKFIKDFFDIISGGKRFKTILHNFELLQKEISDFKENSPKLSDIKDISEDLNILKKYFNISNVIDFSSTNGKFVSTGFYTSEYWGSWMKEYAEVYLRPINITKDINLDFYLSVFMPEKEKTLQIYVNETLLETISSNNVESPLHITIPKDLADNNLTISFVSTNLISPSEAGLNIDTRKLAFGLIKIVADTQLVTHPFDFGSKSFKKEYNCNFNNELWDNYLIKQNIQEVPVELKKGVENSELADLLLKRRTEPFSFTPEENYLRKMILQNDLSQYNNIVDKTGFQPEVFYFKNGLSFIDENIVKKHLEKGCVIDGGACTGDSALMFSQYDFVNKIYSFEPCHTPYLNSKNVLEINNCTKAEAVNMGLSDEVGESEILGEKCSITTIDNFAQDKTVGCIKLDIEGLELNALKGAIETIKRDCPLLLICLYHTPQDFFEIKPLLESLNLGYKFKFVNTEPCNSLIGVHLVLIAYKDE